MADNPTIGVDLGGTITTTGGLNSQALQSFADFITSHHYTFESVPKSAFPLPDGVFGTLIDDPLVTLNDTSAGLNTGGNNATVIGGGANTGIVAMGGALTYTGAAGQIFVTEGSGSIVSSAASAVINAVDGTYVVTGTGHDTYLLGGTSGLVTASSGGGSAATLQGGVAYTAGAADTIAATAGTSTVFGTTGDVYTGNAASVFFVGLASANTVLGGTGADTVYGDGTTFIAGTGANVFAGDTTTAAASSASTIYAGGGGASTIQAGAHGDLVFTQQSAARVVSGGGRDTIWGSSNGIAPTIFGTTNSYELLVGNMKGGLAIALGNNTTLDGANTSGGLTYFANPGYGNQTFYGSVSGNDSFYIGSQHVGTSLIEIHDWHKGDVLNLSAFGAADQASALKALSGGGGLFKLSDGTTVSFVGSHPTGGSGGFLT